MKIKFSLIFSLVCLCMAVFEPSASAQDMKKLMSVDISKLSDAQISKAVAEIKSRGMTMEDAYSMAKSQGVSSYKINQFRSRVNRLSSVAGKQKSASASADLTNDDVDIIPPYSERASYNYTALDSTIFGFNIFNSERLSFEPGQVATISDSYVIGPGDMLNIDIWGGSQQSYELEVRSDGSVIIPLAGQVAVGGHTFAEARRMVMSKLSSLYSDLSSAQPKTFASVNIGTVRSIRVSVMGEVFVPGTYTVSGASTLFNVLYLSGGPNSNGSYRDVQLLRGGRVIARLDVYDFLVNGKPTANVSLADGDIVMVPTFRTRVSVGGMFKRNGLFEAAEGETVADIVRYAGGFKPYANSAHIEVFRRTERGLEVRDADETSKMLLINGDSIACSATPERRQSCISIEQGVYRPGSYEYVQGMTLSQLIAKAGGLSADAFSNRGVVMRLRDDKSYETIKFDPVAVQNGNADIVLEPNDEILLSDVDSIMPRRTVRIYGAVNAPGLYAYGDNMTLGDLVLMANGFNKDASTTSIEVSRRLSDDILNSSSSKTREIIKIENIDRSLSTTDSGSSFALQPYDIVSVKNMPGARDRGVVTVIGCVNHAGDFSLTSANETLSGLIERVGGFTDDADLNGAKLFRRRDVITPEERARREEMMRKDTTLRFSDFDYELVAIDLPKIMKNRDKDILMNNGDRLYVPSRTQTVRVSGEVLNPVLTTFMDGKNAKEVVMMSGGFSPLAKKSKTYVIYPNGYAMATKHFLFFTRYPRVVDGAEIVVPKKPARDRLSTMQWVSIGTSLTTMAAVIVSLTR